MTTRLSGLAPLFAVLRADEYGVIGPTARGRPAVVEVVPASATDSTVDGQPSRDRRA